MNYPNITVARPRPKSRGSEVKKLRAELAGLRKRLESSRELNQYLRRNIKYAMKAIGANSAAKVILQTALDAKESNE